MNYDIERILERTGKRNGWMINWSLKDSDNGVGVDVVGFTLDGAGTVGLLHGVGGEFCCWDEGKCPRMRCEGQPRGSSGASR